MNKFRLRVAPLSRRLVIARFGKDPTVALDTRDVSSEFWQALVSYAFDGKIPDPGQAVEIQFGGGDEQFTVVVKRETSMPDLKELREKAEALRAQHDRLNCNVDACGRRFKSDKQKAAEIEEAMTLCLAAAQSMDALLGRIESAERALGAQGYDYEIVMHDDEWSFLKLTKRRDRFAVIEGGKTATIDAALGEMGE